MDETKLTLEQGVFRGLPDWVREGRPNPTVSRKRRPDSGGPPMPQPARSHPDISALAREPPVEPGLHRRAETFPKQNASLPLVQQTPAFDPRINFVPTTQTNGSSTGPYTPTTPSFNQGGFSSNGLDDSSPNGMLPYNFGSDIGQPNLPDLSAMMFPSAEPFNYPNQPLTTFENNQYSKDGSGLGNFGSSSAASMMPTQTSNPSEGDNLEAQFYTLPPYMMAQRQQQQQQQQQQPGWDLGMQPQMNGMRHQMSGNNMDNNMLSGNETWGGQQVSLGQNVGFSGMNLSEIFGGDEWNGMLMDQGFRR